MKEYIKIEILKNDKINIFRILKILLFSLNKRFLFLLRTLFWSKNREIPFLTGYINRIIILKFGCYVGLNSKIGIGTQFPHPNGIIIGDGAEIGENCIIFQQVTLGGKNIGDAQKMNYPKIGDNVIIYAGAKILGNIKVGDNAIIGANSVVNKNVPPFAIVGGIPAKIIKYNNQELK